MFESWSESTTWVRCTLNLSKYPHAFINCGCTELKYFLVSGHNSECWGTFPLVYFRSRTFRTMYVNTPNLPYLFEVSSGKTGSRTLYQHSTFSIYSLDPNKLITSAPKHPTYFARKRDICLNKSPTPLQNKRLNSTISLKEEKKLPFQRLFWRWPPLFPTPAPY